MTGMKVEEEYLVYFTQEVLDKYSPSNFGGKMVRVRNGSDSAWYVHDFSIALQMSRWVKVTEREANDMLGEEMIKGEEFPNEIWF